MDKLLTIAIPTYNREKLLDRLLASIETQVCDEIEVLVSDNASQDNTESLVAEKYPFVQYCRNKENIGACNNFVECYKKARGKYIWLVGSDDIITQGSVNTILSFIAENISMDMPIIFLNHNFFEGIYSENIKFQKAFLKETNRNFVAKTKEEFMAYAGKQLTFMSAFLLDRRVFTEVENPERYFETFFFHTCLAFSAKTTEESSYGIIGNICVSQDLTKGNSLSGDDFEVLFKIFGKWMKYVYVCLAPQYGYSKKQMKSIYIHAMGRFFISWTMRMKVKNQQNERDAFWKYCFPAIKEYPVAWITVIPIAIMPHWMAVVCLHIRNR